MSKENSDLYAKFAECVADLCNSLSHKARVMILLSLGKISLASIMRKVGLSSYQALQRHIDVLIDKGLIVKTNGKGSYEPTKYGENVLSLLMKFEEVPEIRKRIKAEKRKRLKVAIAKFGVGLTREDLLQVLEESQEKDEEKT